MARSSKNSPVKVKATSAATWRKNNSEVFTLTLSSGNVVDLVPVQLDQLILSGRIPHLLAPLAAKTLWQDPEKTDLEVSLDPENTKRYMELVDVVVPSAVVSPKIRIRHLEETKTLEEDELWLDELTFIEKVEIFKLAVQPSEVLRHFRKQQERALESVRNLQDVEPEA